jgi:hypothetical protein
VIFALLRAIPAKDAGTTLKTRTSMSACFLELVELNERSTEMLPEITWTFALSSVEASFLCNVIPPFF